MLTKSKYILLFLVSSTLFYSCKSTKVNTNFPFKLIETSYYRWSGGQPGVKGTNVVLKIRNANLTNFEADSIYFNNKVVKAETHIKKDTIIFMGYFTEYKAPVDLELTPQLNNKIPLLAFQNPYHLIDNEAIFTYFLNGKKQFIKISNLKETDKNYYP